MTSTFDERLNSMREWEKASKIRSAEINKMNMTTIESLVDGQKIKFRNINHPDIESDDETYDDDTHGLLYEDFMKNEINLKGNDDIVLKQSFILVHYDYPSYDRVTFTIKADNELIGFTRRELAVKCMKYFHLQLYLYQNYNMEKGEFDPLKGSGLFKPFYLCDYTDNGLSDLVYNKQKNYWVFTCMNYM